MGYYGLGPGMKVPDQLTPMEKSLRDLPVEIHQQVLDVLETLIKNIAQKPAEEKFRKIKLENKKISQCVTSFKGAIDFLFICGFEFTDDENSLVLPMTIKLNFPDHVNKIIDAKDFYRKENEKLRVAKGLSRVAPAGEPKPEDPRTPEEIAEATAKNLEYVKAVRKITA